jgi:hypothetical protein
MTQLFVDTLANEAGTGPTELTKQSAAKAYYTYEQNANTGNDSLNVSSYTDNGGGDSTASYTNSFSQSEPAGLAFGTLDVGGGRRIAVACTNNSSSQRVQVQNSSFNSFDAEQVVGIIHGTLA